VRSMILAMSLLALLTGFAPSDAVAAGKGEAGSTLYSRLGGRPGVEAILDDLFVRAAADDRIKEYFAGADLSGMKKQMADQICELAGGPCTYEGKPMLAAHAGKGITEAQFMAFMHDLVDSMQKLKVGKTDVASLTGLLLPMKQHIVESPEKP